MKEPHAEHLLKALQALARHRHGDVETARRARNRAELGNAHEQVQVVEPEARRLIDICLDAGVTLFDSADVYSDGAAESILGAALEGRRDRAIISTKVTLRSGDDPNAVGASRSHLLRSVERALERLRTDYIDVLHLHHFDSMTPVEATMATLDDVVRAGKVRYVGVSNFSGWQAMKALAASERRGYARVVSQQVYYSLIGCDYEWELMPLGLAENIAAMVWSSLGWGRLTGRIRRERPEPPSSRLRETAAVAPPVDDARLYRVVDALAELAAETGRSIPQIAINWLLQRPTVATVLIGARNEQQLRDNLGAAGWALSAEQVARLDVASDVTPPTPTTRTGTGNSPSGRRRRCRARSLRFHAELKQHQGYA